MIAFYKAQGVIIVPKMLEGIPEHDFEWNTNRDVTENRPIFTLINWFFSKKIFQETITGHDHDNSPKVFLWNLFGKPLLTIQDPAIVQDIYTTKNQVWDKTGVYA